MKKDNAPKFSDIDTTLQSHFMIQFFYIILLQVANIALLFVIKNLKFALLGEGLLLTYAAFIVYRILSCLDNKVSIIEGVCKEVYTKTSKKEFFDRPYILLENNNYQGELDGPLYVKVYIGKSFKATEGAYYLVYAPNIYILQENDNTYIVNSFYYIHKKKN